MTPFTVSRFAYFGTNIISYIAKTGRFETGFMRFLGGTI